MLLFMVADVFGYQNGNGGFSVLVQFHDYLYTLPLEGSTSSLPSASTSTLPSPSTASTTATTTTSSKKKNKLEVLPETYRPLIVMLGQESSLSGSKELARYIRSKIKPAVMGMGEDEGVVGKCRV
jgi:hypothetical protein